MSANGAFIKLEDNASGTKAPILRYSIPQKSEFSAYGHVKLPLSFDKFIEYDPPILITPTANELAQDVLFPGHSYFVQNPHLLQTSETVPVQNADALLGQGDALDCFNGHVQEAKKNQIWLENAKTQLALTTLSDITDPIVRAEWFAKLFNPPPATTETPTL